MTAIGKAIKRLRRQRGLSQIGLAKKMRLTQSAICQAETSVTTPRIATLRRFAGVFGASLNELLQ
jgi:transcriptional regulator with XRE-family HTH domain